MSVQAGADEFVLAPVDAASADEHARGRSRRPRRLIVDKTIMIPSETIKRHISNVDDVVRQSVDLAPPTKQLMACKDTSSVDRMFVLPGRHLASSQLLKVDTRQCLTTSWPVEREGGGRKVFPGPTTFANAFACF